MASDSFVVSELQRLSQVSSAGFVIALHVRYTAARYMFESYPDAWRDEYGREGYVMVDPTVRWALHNHGTTRWTALHEMDGAGVLEKAKDHGIAFGATVSIHDGKDISMAGFSRPDRNFTDLEIRELDERLHTMHEATRTRMTLGTDASEKLHRMSVILTEQS